MTRVTSPVAEAVHATFADAFAPLLRRLRFEPVKPKRVKPGLVVAQAARALDAQRCVEATLWCNATGGQLRFRLDDIGPINGVVCTGQIDLKVPWPDPSYPRARSLDFCGADFRTHEGVERLRAAIRCLAGGFAANADAIAAAIPDLADDLRTAAATPEWHAAIAEGAALWARRFAPFA